jgi:rod shape-determining protein MreD
MTSDPRLRLPLVVITVLFVQLTVLTHVRLFGVMPDAMLLLAIAGGMTGGPTAGAIVGFCSGMAIDLFLQTPMGLSALVFCLVGYVVGLLQATMLRSAWWIPLMTAFVASAAGVTLFAVVGSVVGESEMVNARLAVIVIVVSVANLLLAPIVIRLVRWAMADQAVGGAFAH